MQDVGRPHRPQIAHQVIERGVIEFDAVDVDDGRGEAGAGKKLRKARAFDSRMEVRAGLAGDPIRSQHGIAQSGQALAAGNSAEQQAAGLQDQMQRGRGERQVVRGIEDADAQDEVEGAAIERQ